MIFEMISRGVPERVWHVCTANGAEFFHRKDAEFAEMVHGNAPFRAENRHTASPWRANETNARRAAVFSFLPFYPAYHSGRSRKLKLPHLCALAPSP